VKKPPDTPAAAAEIPAQPIKSRRDFLGAGTRLAVAASLHAGSMGAFVR
jgi:hypothetical protein